MSSEMVYREEDKVFKKRKVGLIERAHYFWSSLGVVPSWKRSRNLTSFPMWTILLSQSEILLRHSKYFLRSQESKSVRSKADNISGKFQIFTLVQDILVIICKID